MVANAIHTLSAQKIKIITFIPCDDFDKLLKLCDDLDKFQGVCDDLDEL